MKKILADNSDNLLQYELNSNNKFIGNMVRTLLSLQLIFTNKPNTYENYNRQFVIIPSNTKLFN